MEYFLFLLLSNIFYVGSVPTKHGTESGQISGLQSMDYFYDPIDFDQEFVPDFKYCIYSVFGHIRVFCLGAF